MINLSIKILRSAFDIVSLAATFYLLAASLAATNSPFQSFVLYPVLLLTVISIAYFIHTGLNNLALKVAYYQVKIVKISPNAITKQPLAH